MVATTLAVAAGTAVVAYEASQRIALNKDERIDSGIKAAAGLACIVGSVPVKNAYGKGALLGAGIGLSAGAAKPYVPFLN